MATHDTTGTALVLPLWRLVLPTILIALGSSLPNQAATAAPPGASPADWPAWRGPGGNNHAAGPPPPIQWTVGDAKWRAGIPGRGHASPCVVGDKVFLASADEASETQFMLALDRNSGKQLWRTDLLRGSLPEIHANNSHASATSASDGEFVYYAGVGSGELHLVAVDVGGQITWTRSICRFEHANGFASSPILYGELVIVSADNQSDPCITACNRQTGEIVWQISRAPSDNSATPIVASVGGRDQLLINGANTTSSYNPLDGAPIWHVTHRTEVVACTMAFDDQCVYASGNVPEPNMLCVRADGQGDVSETHVLWQTGKSITYVPSPLVVGDLLFLVTDAGIAFCRKAQSGEVIWKQRLGGNFFSSPLLAAGNIYATSESGVTYVFSATEEYELLAENNVEEPCLATPAVCGGAIYLRTTEHLYCFENLE